MAEESKQGVSMQQTTVAENVLHDETEVKQWETEKQETQQTNPKDTLINKPLS